MKRLTTLAGVAGLMVALVPATALAEPARTIELGPGKTASQWTASGSGVIADRGMYSGDGDVPYPQYNESGCLDGLHDCDDTLIKVTAPGDLTFKTTGESQSVPNVGDVGPDSDLRLFTSDAAGKQGEEIGYSAAANPTGNETITAFVEPGFYLARIDFTATAPVFEVAAESGLAVDPAFLTAPLPVPTPSPAPAPAPAPTPAADPAPAAAPAPAPAPVAAPKAVTAKAKTISCKGKKGKALKSCKKKVAAQKKAAAKKKKASKTR